MITIVTDSTAYFTKEEAKMLNIKVVPITYNVSGQIYNETYSDCNGDFERLLKNNMGEISTSQTNSSVFLSAFEEILREKSSVLCITLSSRLSGTYSSAVLAAKQCGNPNVLVLDSLLTAGGLYLLVKRAKALIDLGHTINDVYNKLLELREKITIAFSVDDMTPLRKSGRIGIVRMSVSTILNIKPILMCVDGAVISDSVVRGKSELLKAMLSKISKDAKEIVINYIGNHIEASTLYTLLKKNHPNALIFLRKMGPVLGTHLGRGVLGVCSITE